MLPHFEHLTIDPVGFNKFSFRLNLLEQLMHSMTIKHVSFLRQSNEKRWVHPIMVFVSAFLIQERVINYIIHFTLKII